MMISATITDHDTEEDSPASAKAARVLTESFLRRPALRPEAVRMCSKFMNDALYVMRTPKTLTMCDCAAVMLLRDGVRWFTAGDSQAFHFVDNALEDTLAPAPSLILGEKPDFKVRLEKELTLKEGNHAFLLCSRTLAQRVSPEMMAETLRHATSPEDWMERLKHEAGEDAQFCANAIILRNKRRRLPMPMLIAGGAVIAVGLFLLIRMLMG